MTYRVVAALLTAVTATVITAIGTALRWPAEAPLLTIAATGWILFAIVATGDRITSSIEQAAERLERASGETFADGVIEGTRRATPPGLRGVH